MKHSKPNWACWVLLVICRRLNTFEKMFGIHVWNILSANLSHGLTWTYYRISHISIPLVFYPTLWYRSETYPLSPSLPQSSNFVFVVPHNKFQNMAEQHLTWAFTVIQHLPFTELEIRGWYWTHTIRSNEISMHIDHLPLFWVLTSVFFLPW